MGRSASARLCAERSLTGFWREVEETAFDVIKEDPNLGLAEIPPAPAGIAGSRKKRPTEHPPALDTRPRPLAKADRPIP
jgi:hypothetical protein